ncbi:MAG: glycine cleavage system protein H, partial [Thaumarchaeota archaeon]|nr:glycine cleavage system protein H [Nitrososphaerota archaeon]
MDIGGCCFPDDLLYDAEGLTWVRIDQGRLTFGLTQFHVFKIGKMVSVRIKGQGIALQKGSSVAFIEIVKCVGHARTPVSGVIEEINVEVSMIPALINRDPYGRG